MSATYAIHPLAELFPQMSAEEFSRLKQDVATNGQQDPIVISVDCKTILDGRHRLRACAELGIPPKFINFCKITTGAVIDIPNAEVAFIWSKNFLRRHLSSDQRAAIAVGWSDAIKAAARQRQREHGGTAPGKPNTFGESTKSVHTREAIAAQAQVSPYKVRQAEVIARHAPELLPKIAAGQASLKHGEGAVKVRIKEKSTVNHAANIAKNHPDQVIDAEFHPKDPAVEMQEKVFKHLGAAMDLAQRHGHGLQAIIRKLRNYADQLEILERKNSAALKKTVEDLGVHASR
jgi:hypothetical protein